ncbi:Ubiquitin carboxyl-terminal hydrolase 24 [Hondaea fermentalgiana]|uniref:ubiquitinyl hydrolase 1 n=1 Tax=Hondaea fermentalgiana TaxID=2315210 RepID=A0A2R5FYJ9_9STRA|nr:Ubiquitin carboxyl-terminal hydrolase 24 [Hondaea fermentalgiana]|eukprot:GBG23832.1 Ubiquitin carboxyl-terminal hydrolase 24 [Hondaea fermentalgiana]
MAPPATESTANGEAGCEEKTRNEGGDAEQQMPSLSKFQNNCSLFVRVVSKPDSPLNTTLTDFTTWINWINQGMGSPDHVAFFYRSAIPQMTTAVLKRYYNAQELPIVNEFLQKLVVALLGRLRAIIDDGFSEPEMASLVELLRPHNSFYYSYGLEEAKEWRREVHQLQMRQDLARQGHIGAARGLGPGEPAAHEDWLDAFGEGDVGFVQTNASDRWMPCRVLQVSPTNTEVEIEILELGENPSVIEVKWLPKDPKLFRPFAQDHEQTAEKVDLVPEPATGNERAQDTGSDDAGPANEDSTLHAPQVDETADGSTSSESDLGYEEEAWLQLSQKDQNWHLSLSIGDMCDAQLDEDAEDAQWYQAIVVAIEKADADNQTTSPNDLLTLTFVGFPPSKDARAARGAVSRLAPLNAKSFGRRGLQISKAVDTTYADAVVHDADDDEDALAVMRFSRNVMVSTFFVANVDTFVRHGGAETMLAYMKRYKGHVDVLQHGINLFSGMSTVLSRSVARDVLPRFLDSLTLAIEDMGQSQVRQLSKSIVSSILKRMGQIAHRFASHREAATRVEKVALLLAGKRLQSPAIMQRLDGMDLLADIIDRVTNAQSYPAGLVHRRHTAPQFSSGTDDADTTSTEAKARTRDLLSSLFVSRSLSFDMQAPQAKSNSDPAAEVRFAAPAEGPSTPKGSGPTNEFSTPPRPVGKNRDRPHDDGSGTSSSGPAPFASGSSAPAVDICYEYARVPVAWSITKTSLSNWIVSARVIENAVRGPLAHSEMAKRATRLLVFLSEAKSIPKDMLAHIWKGIDEAKGSDRELAEAILRMIAGTVPSLSLVETEEVLHLFSADSGAKSASPKALEVLREVCKSPHIPPDSGRPPSVKAATLLFDLALQDGQNAQAVSSAALDELRAVVAYHASVDMMRAFGSKSRKTPVEPASGGSQQQPGQENSQTQVSSQAAMMLTNVLTAAQAATAGCGLDEDGKTLREALFRRALTQLDKDQASVLPALRVLQVILRSYPRRSELGTPKEDDLAEHLSGRESREDVVEWLALRHALVDVCFQSCERMSTQAAASGLGVHVSNDHAPALLAELDFVLVLLSESNLVLSKEQIHKLWTALVTSESANRADREACFRFLAYCAMDRENEDEKEEERVKSVESDAHGANRGTMVGMDEGTLRAVFADLLGSRARWQKAEEDPDPSVAWPAEAMTSLQLAALQLNRFQGRLNWERSHLDPSAARKGTQGELFFMKTPASANAAAPKMNTVRVTAPESLEGEDVLWYLALHARSDDTARRAADVLCRLHLGAVLAPEASLQYREVFLEKCMQHLQESTTEATKSFARGSHAAIRCLGLVRPLLLLTEHQTSVLCDILGADAWRRVAPHAASTVGQSFEVTVVNNFRGSPGHNTKSVIMVSTKDPIWRLREQVANCLELDSPSRLRIFVGGKEIKLEAGSRLIRDVHGLSPGVTLLSCEKPPAAVAADAALRERVLGVQPGPSNADDLPEVTRPDPRAEELEAPERKVLAQKKLAALPSVVLASNKRYSELLFQLLDACAEASSSRGRDPTHEGVANALAADVWRLLQALPSNEGFKRTERLVEELRKESGSLLKLLYVVELVESLFASDDSTQEAEAQQFIKSDGVQHLSARLTEVTSRAPSELGQMASFGFRAAQLLSVLGKLVRLSFFITAASLEASTVENSEAHKFVLGLMPRMTTLVRLQKEVDLSGLVMMDIATAFPFEPLRPITTTTATAVHDNSAPNAGEEASTASQQVNLATPELASLRHAVKLLAPVAGEAEAETAARAAEAALKAFILKPLEPTGIPSDLLPGVKRSLLILCAFGVGAWALSSLRNASTENLLVYLQEGLARADGPVPTITRFAFRNAFQRLARIDVELGARTLSALARVSPPLRPATASDQYFSLFEQLICSPEIAKRASQEHTFIGPLMESVRLVLGSSDTDEELLEGYFHVLSCGMSQTGPDEALDIVHLLLSDCLFPVHDTESVPHGVTASANPSVRMSAFQVLTKAVIAHPNLWEKLVGPRLREVCSISLNDLHEFQVQKSAIVARPTQGPATQQEAAKPLSSSACWSIDLGSDRRAPCGFVGLVNLGFICYMNSLVQQVFNIPRLRYGILRARLADANGSVSEEGKSPEDGKVTDVQRDVLQEIQRMMVALDLSVKQAYNPSGWCQAFKDEQGQPVNLFEQQDAHEFFNSLCDRIDEMLDKSGQPKLMTKAIGVSIANQLICVDPAISGDGSGETLQRENPSVREYCLTQELGDGITSLHESLRNFVGGEVINDYSWEERDNAKLRTLKRQCIAELSDVVFVHLKRFRLNWATLMTEKINSRFEFPLEIDFFPYTKEGLEWKGDANDEARYGSRGKEYYHFELAGIVVHSGASLNSGHYYSYIRSRFGTGVGQWFEFNDRVVKPFDINTLEEATFGGGSRVSSYGVEIPSVSNAYMLVYERRQKVQAEADFMGAEAASYVAQGAGIPEAARLRLMPEGMADAVVQQNRVIGAVQRVLEPGIAMLFKKIAQTETRGSSASSKPSDMFIVDATVYALDTLARATYGRSELPDLLMGLQGLLVGNVVAARSCLEALTDRSASHNLLGDLLLQQQGSEDVRESAGALLGLLLAEASGLDASNPESAWSGLEAFLTQLVEIPLANGHVRANLRTHTQWWSVVHVAARHFARAREYLAKHGVIAHVIDMFMGSASPLRGAWSDFPSLGPEPAPELLADVCGVLEADWTEAFGVVRELCVGGEASLDEPGWSALQVADVLEQSLLHLHRFEQEHSLRSPRQTPAVSLGDIYGTLSQHDAKVRAAVFDALVRHISGATRHGLSLYFATLEQVLQGTNDLVHAEAALRQPFAEIVALHAMDTLYLCEFTRLALGLYLEQPVPFLLFPEDEEAREEAVVLPWLAGTMQYLAEHVETSSRLAAEHGAGGKVNMTEENENDAPELVAPAQLAAQSSGADTAGESDAPRIPQEDFELLSTMYDDILELLHGIDAGDADLDELVGLSPESPL